MEPRAPQTALSVCEKRPMVSVSPPVSGEYSGPCCIHSFPAVNRLGPNIQMLTPAIHLLGFLSIPSYSVQLNIIYIASVTNKITSRGPMETTRLTPLQVDKSDFLQGVATCSVSLGRTTIAEKRDVCSEFFHEIACDCVLTLSAQGSLGAVLGLPVRLVQRSGAGGGVALREDQRAALQPPDGEQHTGAAHRPVPLQIPPPAR